MSQIEIIDDYLPQDTFNTLQEHLLSHRFPWYFNEQIIKGIEVISIDNSISDYRRLCVNNYQFTHVIEPPSPLLDIIVPLFDKINPKEIIRCKLNLNPITQQHEQSPYHVDQNENTNHKIAIYYINTNNGYTIFEHNKQQVESIANRIVIFDGHLKHAGCSCTNQKRRVVLNLNYL